MGDGEMGRWGDREIGEFPDFLFLRTNDKGLMTKD
jgi:sarcosine oxidase delta subunit